MALKARKFAAEINAAAPKADGSATDDAPEDWYADPYERHEVRWWDGQKWTQFVRDTDGLTGIDPPV
jgi:hypothetical protein